MMDIPPVNKREEKVWWQGYYRGLKESSESWLAAVMDVMDKHGGYHHEFTSAIVNSITEQADRELGFGGESDSTELRSVD